MRGSFARYAEVAHFLAAQSDLPQQVELSISDLVSDMTTRLGFIMNAERSYFSKKNHGQAVISVLLSPSDLSANQAADLRQRLDRLVWFIAARLFTDMRFVTKCDELLADFVETHPLTHTHTHTYTHNALQNCF